MISKVQNNQNVSFAKLRGAGTQENQNNLSNLIERMYAPAPEALAHSLYKINKVSGDTDVFLKTSEAILPNETKPFGMDIGIYCKDDCEIAKTTVMFDENNGKVDGKVMPQLANFANDFTNKFFGIRKKDDKAPKNKSELSEYFTRVYA